MGWGRLTEAVAACSDRCLPPSYFDAESLNGAVALPAAALEHNAAACSPAWGGGALTGTGTTTCEKGGRAHDSIWWVVLEPGGNECGTSVTGGRTLERQNQW